MYNNLTEYRSPVKRYAVYRNIGHLPGMTGRGKKPKTTTQEMFLRRVNQELERQQISRNALCQRPGGPTQSTFNEVMNGSDPRLETVHQIATALDVPVWTLLTERLASGKPYNVADFPKPPPPTQAFVHSADRKNKAKRKRSA
jgi:transcriptional regulator with XRE-family HTH domain